MIAPTPKSSVPTLPSVATLKLFLTGSTIGPIVDSLHNQSLLKYDRAPINLVPLPPTIASNCIDESMVATITTAATDTSSATCLTQYSQSYLFSSSWYIPILLGVAYVVLGEVLPHLIQLLLDKSNVTRKSHDKQTISLSTTSLLRNKAILAVTTTSLIIKLSDFLQTHPHLYHQEIMTQNHSMINLIIMILAALTQWIVLDGTTSSFITAFIVSIGGPLSELPFVATGFWHYIESAADYLPLTNNLGFITIDEKYQHLALSSITGPCYFAVTMDAIALGRWFTLSSISRDE
jgi:hypothetical protein